jgi:hypothetical protein
MWRAWTARNMYSEREGPKSARAVAAASRTEWESEA